MGLWNSDRGFLGLSLPLAVTILLLAGCLDSPEENHSGVDDFPNSIYARVEGHLDDAAETETAALPGEALLVLQGQVTAPAVNALPKGSALARSAARLTNHAALAKSAAKAAKAAKAARLSEAAMAAQAVVDSGWIVYAETTTNAAKTITTVNTLYFLAGTDITDSLQRILGLAASHKREEYSTGKVSIVEVSDADGDGLLILPLVGARVAMHIEESDGGVVETADLVADGGPDQSLDTEADNRIYKAHWRKVRASQGEDTLSFAEYADADGDGIVIDNSLPTLVDLEFFEKDPAGKPDVRESRLSLRLRVSYGQEQQEIRRFKASEVLRDGRLQATDFSNGSGGEDIDPRGRTAVRIRQSRTPEGDTVISMETMALVQPETLLGLDKDSLIAYSVRVEKRLGEETSVYFALEGEAPAPPQSHPRNGAVTMEIAYRDGTRVAVSGRLDQGAFTALITARDGKVYDAQWDKAGKLIRLQERRP